MDHSLSPLPQLWRFPMGWGLCPTAEPNHKSDFPWNHGERTGTVTGLFLFSTKTFLSWVFERQYFQIKTERNASSECCKHLLWRKKSKNDFEAVTFARIMYGSRLHVRSLSVPSPVLPLPSYHMEQYRWPYWALMAAWILSAGILPIHSSTSLTLQKNVKIKYFLVLIIT